MAAQGRLSVLSGLRITLLSYTFLGDEFGWGLESGKEKTSFPCLTA
jgi:hypothetical protein